MPRIIVLAFLPGLFGCGNSSPSIPALKPHLTDKQQVVRGLKAVWGNDAGGGGLRIIQTTPYANPAVAYALQQGYLTTPPTTPSTACTPGNAPDPDGDPDDNICPGTGTDATDTGSAH